MKTAAKYRRFAAECRELARTEALQNYRRLFSEMAEEWEQLAKNRLRELAERQ